MRSRALKTHNFSEGSKKSVWLEVISLKPFLWENMMIQEKDLD